MSIPQHLRDFETMNSRVTTERGKPGTGARGGFALITVVLVTLVAAALVTSAIVVGSGHMLANRYYDQATLLEDLAVEGLELGRAIVNSGKAGVYPDSGYVELIKGEAVKDGLGQTIPGLKRWVYVGPTGSTSGQYGVFGSIVSVVEDGSGAVQVRRSQVFQESFAKYAYFTDFEPSNISFGGGDQIWGPVHTNSDLKIYSSGATFHGEARTAGRVQGAAYGTFKQGYEEYVATIPMPSTADLNKLQAQAASGSMDFTGSSSGGHGESDFRIEFVAIDLNGDGDTTDDNEGFIKAYRAYSSDWSWVGAERVSDMRNHRNCGDYHSGQWISADDHVYSSSSHDALDALVASSRRCFLGGANEMNPGGVFVADDGEGRWLQWPGTVSPLLTGRADADYLWPISRALNPDFKGVIYVDGDVMISGVVRGRVTLAATDDIIIGDDVIYSVDPGAGTCTDMLGMFAGDDVIIADNTINAPAQPASGWNHRSYDDTRSEFIHGVVLALDIFTVENFNSGSTNDEWCESQVWGRGCIYLSGGIIQNTRGAVGTTAGTGGLKRYSYDTCGQTDPPPYFPTTGHFAKGQVFNIDPVGFDIAKLFERLTTN